MNEFLKYLEISKGEVFVDTVGANHKVSVKHLYKTWVKRDGDFFWFKENRINEASVAAYFIPDPKERYSRFRGFVGSGKITVSYPNLLYGDNVSGIFYTDKEKLFELAKEAIEKNNMYLPAEHYNFGDFKLREIDFSVSFEMSSEEECNEIFRLFYFKRFPNHHVHIEYGPQGTYNEDYDEEDGECFGSFSNNIKIYNKTKEMLEDHDEEITPLTLRLEINCFEDVTGLEFKNKTVNEMFENANLWFLALLKKYNLVYVFLPEEEYFQTIETYFKAKKDEYLKDKNKKEKKYPAYIKNSWNQTFTCLRKINDLGAEDAYRDNPKLYNQCLALTNEIGIDIIYTCLEHRLNIFEHVVYRGNPKDYFINEVSDENNIGVTKVEDAEENNINSPYTASSKCLLTLNKCACFVYVDSDYILTFLWLDLKKLSIGKDSFYKLE